MHQVARVRAGASVVDSGFEHDLRARAGADIDTAPRGVSVPTRGPGSSPPFLVDGVRDGRELVDRRIPSMRSKHIVIRADHPVATAATTAAHR